jgi:hypothetical protein
MKTEHMLTAGEAAKILDMSPGGAHHALGKAHGTQLIPNGHECKVWRESYVRELRKKRDAAGKIPRERMASTHLKNGMPYSPKEYQPGKSYDFDVNDKGMIVERKKTFRGRTCRHEGCTVPVPTGKIYCDKHSDFYKAMQRNVSTHGELLY